MLYNMVWGPPIGVRLPSASLRAVSANWRIWPPQTGLAGVHPPPACRRQEGGQAGIIATLLPGYQRLIGITVRFSYAMQNVGRLSKSPRSGPHRSGCAVRVVKLTFCYRIAWSITRLPLAFTQAWLMRSLTSSLSSGPWKDFLLRINVVDPEIIAYNSFFKHPPCLPCLQQVNPDRGRRAAGRADRAYSNKNFIRIW